MTTTAHVHNLLTTALTSVIFEVPAENIRADDPPPMTVWQQMVNYMRKAGGYEAWFVDILGIRNALTPNMHFQTEGGMVRIVEDVEIKGWLAPSALQSSEQPHDTWERVYADMFDRCIAVGLTISANRRVDDLTNLAEWSFTITNRQVGELIVLEATIGIVALRHQVP